MGPQAGTKQGEHLCTLRAVRARAWAAPAPLPLIMARLPPQRLLEGFDL